MQGASAVGFIGLGNMGLPMSRNLADAGFDLVATDLSADARAAAAAANERIRAVETSAEVAANCQVVILMLPDSDVVSAVVRGPGNASPGDGGIAAELSPGATIIDMSSSFAPETVKLAGQLAERGITLIDAPVSGGVKKAITAELAIMTGGPDAVIADVTPLLKAMGRIFRTGGVGSGHATKALNNFLSASSTIATAEALIIGEKFGLDPNQMNEVFKNSTGCSNTTDVKVAQYFIPERYESGFTLALLHKDVGMARQMADELGIDADMLERVSDLLSRGNDSLASDADHTAMHAYLKSKAGR